MARIMVSFVGKFLPYSFDSFRSKQSIVAAGSSVEEEITLAPNAEDFMKEEIPAESVDGNFLNVNVECIQPENPSTLVQIKLIIQTV